MNDIDPFLLALGPASAVGLYWSLCRHYRNTDKSHAFEYETDVDCDPITGFDIKTDQVEGVSESRIKGDNVSAYRKRVRRVEPDDLTAVAYTRIDDGRLTPY